MSIPFPDCHDLTAIAVTLDFGPAMMRILQKEQIGTLTDLRSNRNGLETACRKTRGAEKRKYRKLIRLSLYADHLIQLHGDDVSMGASFAEDEFLTFQDNVQKENERSLDEICFGKQPKPDNMDQDEIDKYMKKLIFEVTGNVSKECLGALIKCDFGPEEFAHALLRSRVDGTKYHVIEGRTQLGKSNVKCLVIGSGIVTKTPNFILTKGVKERDELLGKTKRETKWKTHVSSITAKPDVVIDIVKSHGTIVAAQTAAQIRKIIRIIQKCQREDPSFRFSVTLDEGDTMFRSRGGEEARVQAEQEWRNLLDLKPQFVVMISATILPILLHLVDMDNALQNERSDSWKIRFRLLKPSDNYLGVESFVPLKGNDGVTDIYLEHTITYNGGQGINIGKIGPIPFTDFEGHVKKLYDHALQHCPVDQAEDSSDVSSQSKRAKLRDIRYRGVCLLDISDPRVAANGHVFTKAQMVQDAYYKTEKKRIVAIVFVGNGIHVRHNPKDRGFFHEEYKGKTISEVIQEIDDDPGHGLDKPIFIFGFSKMNRGMSFRSTNRVPTHMLVSRGGGYSIEDVIQTLGRGTFNGRDVLEKNGFQNVTVLCEWRDLMTAKSYHSLTEFIQWRMQEGDTLGEAISGKKVKLPEHANAFRYTDRKVGPGAKARSAAGRIMKDLKVLGEEAFEEPTECSEYLLTRFHGEELDHLEAISLYWDEHPIPFTAKELTQAHDITLQANIRLASLNKNLRLFNDFGLVEKARRESDWVWSVKNPSALKQIIEYHPDGPQNY